MPRGSNPNSHTINKVNSGRTREERIENAREAGKRSGEVRAYNADIKRCLKDMLTDDRLMKATDQVIARAEAGNLTAYKMLCDLMVESQQTNSNDIKIIIEKSDYDEWSN